ncbi:MAG: VWA domain-containing protein [Candidatus Omnitrophica bacterium]|nr:VWA domain-containing protein [Candidatus Omnitrophota bacterium]
MRFGDPRLAYTLWSVAALGAFYFWAFKRKEKTLRRFAEDKLLNEISASRDTGKEKLKVYLLTCAFLLLILAAMRPQWGFHWEEVKRQGIDILIALDTSNSMLAEDVKPSRIERSKLAIKDLVGKLKGDRVGLIAFAGSAFLQCPLTTDYNGFILSLDSMNVDTIPRGGTSISSAIKEAIKVLKDEPESFRVLILITDGEDHEGNPLEWARIAEKNKIRIFCIGIGTPEGELIYVQDEHNRGSFLKDREGNAIKSKLNERVLEKIALATKGTYVHATGAQFGLDLIYKDRLSVMEKRALESKLVKQYEERFQIPLGCAILLLVAAMSVGERKKKIDA